MNSFGSYFGCKIYACDALDLRNNRFKRKDMSDRDRDEKQANERLKYHQNKEGIRCMHARTRTHTVQKQTKSMSANKIVRRREEPSTMLTQRGVQLFLRTCVCILPML